MATLTKNIKAGNFSYTKSEFNEAKGYSKHFVKYNHEQKDGGSFRGAAKFKSKFQMSFPRGLYLEQKEGDPFRKLMGKASLDLNDPKVVEFCDTPDRGSRDGWVHKDDVEMVEFNTFKAKEDISLYTEPSKEEEACTVKEGTTFISDAKDDDFYHVTYGGGGEGTLYNIRKGIAKALWKAKKQCRIKDVKSEQALEKAIKFPVWFHKNEEGELTGKGSWYLKITYREDDGDKEGYMCKFEVPGVRELTLEELQSNAITGMPCFSVSNLYVGGGKHSLQIYLSSFVVTNIEPIEYQSAQQDDIDEYAQDEEFVKRMRALVPEKPPSPKLVPKRKKGGKSGDKDKGKSSKKKDIKDIIAPTLEPVDIDGGSDDDDDDSEDEPIAGVPPATDGDSDEEVKSSSADKKPQAEEDSEEEEAPPKEKKSSKKKKKEKGKANKETSPPPSDSDEEETPPPLPSKKEKGKGKKEKKPPPPSSESEDDD